METNEQKSKELELPLEAFCKGCGMVIGYCDCSVNEHLNKHLIRPGENGKRILDHLKTKQDEVNKKSSKLFRISGEYIICAAVWFDDGKEYSHQPVNIKTGIVVCGRRHHNCFATTSALIGLVKDRNELNLREREQGFLTSTDRFLTRKEAAELALNRGQFKNEKELKEVEKSNYLYSENLY